MAYIMKYYRLTHRSIRWSMIAMFMASSLFVLAGCNGSSVGPEDEVPAEGVPTAEEATIVDPAAVEDPAAVDPAAIDPATIDPAVVN